MERDQEYEDDPTNSDDIISRKEGWAMVGGVGFGISFHQMIGDWAWVMFLLPFALVAVQNLASRIGAPNTSVFEGDSE